MGPQEDPQAQLWEWRQGWRLWPTTLTRENEAVSTFSVLPFVCPTLFQGILCFFHMAWCGWSRSHVKTNRNRHIHIHHRLASANAHRRLKNVLWTGSTARNHQNLTRAGNGHQSSQQFTSISGPCANQSDETRLSFTSPKYQNPPR